MTQEEKRLEECREGKPWKEWGPYLSERQWATVREDYSEDGNAWESIVHDHARSKSYRWGEDGIGGFSNSDQRICFSWAFWNGKDKILKERLFGLTGYEGNHGEDVKELYYYLDSTPTHSYMKMLYKYPINEFPYSDIVDTNKKLSKKSREYELIDTGVFDKNEYFDFQNEDEYLGAYGVCDTIDQVKEKYSKWLNDPKLKFCISFTKVTKAEQPADGGWRWHKWGEYIGTKEPQYEYLYDEGDDIHEVYCYHIYQLLN